MISTFIIFVSTGLFGYWLARVYMVIFRPERTALTLKNDLWLGRNILLALRSLFFPSLSSHV